MSRPSMAKDSILTGLLYFTYKETASESSFKLYYNEDPEPLEITYEHRQNAAAVNDVPVTSKESDQMRAGLEQYMENAFSIKLPTLSRDSRS